MNINSTHFSIYSNTSVSLLDMIPLVHVLIFKSLVPALAHFTQQVLIEYLEMRHPLSPVLASLTVITLFPFIAIHLLLCVSWWLCRKLLDTLKNYSVISIVVDHTVHMRSLYCTVRGAVLCDAYFEFFLKSKRHFDEINPVKKDFFSYKNIYICKNITVTQDQMNRITFLLWCIFKIGTTDKPHVEMVHNFLRCPDRDELRDEHSHPCGVDNWHMLILTLVSFCCWLGSLHCPQARGKVRKANFIQVIFTILFLKTHTF